MKLIFVKIYFHLLIGFGIPLRKRLFRYPPVEYCFRYLPFPCLIVLSDNSRGFSIVAIQKPRSRFL